MRTCNASGSERPIRDAKRCQWNGRHRQRSHRERWHVGCAEVRPDGCGHHLLIYQRLVSGRSTDETAAGHHGSRRKVSGWHNRRQLLRSGPRRLCGARREREVPGGAAVPLRDDPALVARGRTAAKQVIDLLLGVGRR